MAKLTKRTTEQLRSYLDSLSSDELVDLLLSQAARDDDLRDRLLIESAKGGAAGVDHKSFGLGPPDRRPGSTHRRSRDPFGCRGGEEGAVPCDDHEVGVTNSIGGGEVHGVVATQSIQLGEMPGAPGKHLVELDNVDLLVFGLELSDRGSELPSGQPSETMGLGQSCATLGIDEADTHRPVGFIPESGGPGGPRLGHEQRDDGGGVEVRDHRRWSATRSETVPVPLIGARARRFG